MFNSLEGSDYDPFEDGQEGCFECERCGLVMHADYNFRKDERDICSNCHFHKNHELEHKGTGIILKINPNDPYFPPNDFNKLIRRKLK